MSTYAVLDDSGTIVNVVVCDDPDYASAQGWVGPISTDPGGPGIGYSGVQNDDGSWTWAVPEEES